MKTKAILIDLDGTLVNNQSRAIAHMQRRKEHLTEAEIRWDEFFDKTIKFDQPNPWCMEIIDLFHKQGYKIVFLTGRQDTEITGGETRKWLTMYLNPSIDYDLYMRKEGDFRLNQQIKLDIMINKLIHKYDFLFAIDDMRANVDVFRNLGIPSLHCSDL